MQPFTSAICLGVERHAKPCAALNDFGASRRIILADSSRKDEGVETAERRGERPDLPHDAIDKKRDRLFRRGIPSDARNLHMSDEIPDTPSRPDLGKSARRCEHVQHRLENCP